MGLDLAAASHDLAVERVLDALFDLDDDGLVHLVADDVALTGLTVVAIDGHGVLHACVLHDLVLAHAFAFFSALSAFLSAFAGTTGAGAGGAEIPSSRSRISV